MKRLHNIQLDGIFTIGVPATLIVPSTTCLSTGMFTFTFLLSMLWVMGIPMMGTLLLGMILMVFLYTRTKWSKNLLKHWHQCPHTIMFIITRFSLSFLSSLFLVYFSMVTTMGITSIARSTCRWHHYGDNKTMLEQLGHEHKSQNHELTRDQNRNHNILIHNRKKIP